MIVASSLALLLLAQATPEAAVPPPTPVVAKQTDPLICERQTEPGSLVKKKKVCMRKSEWAERRRDDRMLIERSQTQRSLRGE